MSTTPAPEPNPDTTLGAHASPQLTQRLSGRYSSGSAFIEVPSGTSAVPVYISQNPDLTAAWSDIKEYIGKRAKNIDRFELDCVIGLGYRANELYAHVAANTPFPPNSKVVDSERYYLDRLEDSARSCEDLLSVLYPKLPDLETRFVQKQAIASREVTNKLVATEPKVSNKRVGTEPTVSDKIVATEPILTSLPRPRVSISPPRDTASVSTYPADQILSPPELPPYLKNVHNLKPIVGAPSDDELIGIQDVPRMAHKAIDIPGICDSKLLSRLSEHLFDVQMARYRSAYLGISSPESMTYTPPALPAHVSVRLEPIIGTPSEEEIIKVQDAIRSYQQFANVPSIFDARVNMELSQHFFDLQMARHTQRMRQNQTDAIPSRPPNASANRVVERAVDVTREEGMATNNAGTGADVIETGRVTQDAQLVIHKPTEHSNQLLEHANQLIERSNQLAERSNQILEQFNRLSERSTQQHERFNCLVEELTKPAVRMEDTFKNINRVLVGIQHAVVRNGRNSLSAADCLVNEKGETPIESNAIPDYTGFECMHFKMNTQERNKTKHPMSVNGCSRDSHIPDVWLGPLPSFYGIGRDICKDGGLSVELEEGMEDTARRRLCNYISSRLA